MSQIETKIAEIDNSARIMCKLDTAHRCVDCELCKGEGDNFKEGGQP